MFNEKDQLDVATLEQENNNQEDKESGLENQELSPEEKLAEFKRLAVEGILQETDKAIKRSEAEKYSKVIDGLTLDNASKLSKLLKNSNEDIVGIFKRAVDQMTGSYIEELKTEDVEEISAEYDKVGVDDFPDGLKPKTFLVSLENSKYLDKIRLDMLRDEKIDVFDDSNFNREQVNNFIQSLQNDFRNQEKSFSSCDDNEKDNSEANISFLSRFAKSKNAKFFLAASSLVSIFNFAGGLVSEAHAADNTTDPQELLQTHSDLLANNVKNVPTTDIHPGNFNSEPPINQEHNTINTGHLENISSSTHTDNVSAEKLNSSPEKTVNNPVENIQDNTTTKMVEGFTDVHSLTHFSDNTFRLNPSQEKELSNNIESMMNSKDFAPLAEEYHSYSAASKVNAGLDFQNASKDHVDFGSGDRAYVQYNNTGLEKIGINTHGFSAEISSNEELSNALHQAGINSEADLLNHYAKVSHVQPVSENGYKGNDVLALSRGLSNLDVLNDVYHSHLSQAEKNALFDGLINHIEIPHGGVDLSHDSNDDQRFYELRGDLKEALKVQANETKVFMIDTSGSMKEDLFGKNGEINSDNVIIKQLEQTYNKYQEHPEQLGQEGKIIIQNFAGKLGNSIEVDADYLQQHSFKDLCKEIASDTKIGGSEENFVTCLKAVHQKYPEAKITGFTDEKLELSQAKEIMNMAKQFSDNKMDIHLLISGTSDDFHGNDKFHGKVTDLSAGKLLFYAVTQGEKGYNSGSEISEQASIFKPNETRI